MYLAIVLLPLLGAVVAGIISLVGARNRFPGEEPSLDNHVAAPVAEAHASAAPAPEAAHAAFAHTHVEEREHAPSAAGSLLAELTTSTFLVVSCVLSWFALLDVGVAGHEARVPLFSFITFGDLHSEWLLRIDTLTAVMLVVVTTISSLVHIYSIGYMDEDPYKPRFFSYLSFFTFAMLMLATADNLVQLFFGWEGVGLASYLLIGFWYHCRKPMPPLSRLFSSIASAISAFRSAFSRCSISPARSISTLFSRRRRRWPARAFIF